MNNQVRLIFHIDMNCFFAAVEMAYDKSLRGKPVAVAGNPKERRGIIVTSSYEAREKGVKTTMTVWEAKKLCPNLIVIPPNKERYRKASQALFNILYTYTPLVQQVSIDEGYLDLTAYLYKIHPVQLAREIQQRLAKELMLPSSIGIAPNKFLAKMASDMKKPNGITILRKRDLEKKLWVLPIDEMYGIGKRTVDRWKRMDILTIGDLAKADEILIREKFGDRGHQLQQRARGIDNRPIDPHAHDSFKSIGQSTTLRMDTRNENLIKDTLEALAVRVESRLKRKDVFSGGIQLTIRYSDWKLITRSQKLVNPIQKAEELFVESLRLFNQAWNHEPIRLLGISTYDLIERKYAYKQLNLFSYEKENQVEQEDRKYDESVISWKEDE